MAKRNYYTVLGVAADAEFDDLRKAYRGKAMECHPDRFGGDAGKADEFKVLVEAFNVLTDPVRRRTHDLEIGVAGGGPAVSGAAFDIGYAIEDDGAIMDTAADDILEELIVGNWLNARETTLATLMLDLEQTEQFCLFREAKTCLYRGALMQAEQLFRRYLAKAPGNILARYFLSRCFRSLGRWKEAEGELALAIRIGASRHPPLQLNRMRRELAELRNKRPGFLGVLRRIFGPAVPKPDDLPSEEKERRALNRAINRLAAEQRRKKPKFLSHSNESGD